MHAAMTRVSALLAVCISLYTAGQQIASVQPASFAQPALSAQPVLSNMPPKRKTNVLGMRGKPSSTPAHRKRTTLDVRGKHRVSQRAVEHICKDIKLKGNVTAQSRRSMLRNREARANQDTPFGKLIQEQSLVTKKRRTHQNSIPTPSGYVMGLLPRKHGIRDVHQFRAGRATAIKVG